MALHIYTGATKTGQVSENMQTKLTAQTNAQNTELTVESNVGLSIGDTIRLGEVQRTVDSLPNVTTIVIDGEIGQIFPVDTIVTKSNMASPDSANISGTTGGTDQVALYIGNDSANKRYTTVEITAVNDDSNVDITYAPDVAGSPGTYAGLISIGNISYSGSGQDVVKFWRKVTVASGQLSHERVDIKHKITGIEYAVY